MRVLVDTSAWVDFFNGYPSREADALSRLIDEEADILTCGLVAAEVLQGIRQPKTLRQVERHFREMSWLTPREPDTFIDAAELFRGLRSKGVTIRSTVDCIIAKLAEENDAVLLAKDRDLLAMADSKLIRLRLLPLA